MKPIPLDRLKLDLSSLKFSTHIASNGSSPRMTADQELFIKLMDIVQSHLLGDGNHLTALIDKILLSNITPIPPDLFSKIPFDELQKDRGHIENSLRMVSQQEEVVPNLRNSLIKDCKRVCSETAENLVESQLCERLSRYEREYCSLKYEIEFAGEVFKQSTDQLLKDNFIIVESDGKSPRKLVISFIDKISKLYGIEGKSLESSLRLNNNVDCVRAHRPDGVDIEGNITLTSYFSTYVAGPALERFVSHNSWTDEELRKDPSKVEKLTQSLLLHKFVRLHDQAIKMDYLVSAIMNLIIPKTFNGSFSARRKRSISSLKEEQPTDNLRKNRLMRSSSLVNVPVTPVVPAVNENAKNWREKVRKINEVELNQVLADVNTGFITTLKEIEQTLGEIYTIFTTKLKSPAYKSLCTAVEENTKQFESYATLLRTALQSK